MSTTIDNGGPAFPVPEGGLRYGPEGYTAAQFPGTEGMSLRQWYAGQALAGLVVGCSGVFEDGSFSAYHSGPCNDSVAKRALALADALIAADQAPRVARTETM